MLELPVSAVAAALLAFLAARASLSRRVGPWTVALVAFCALQSLTIALVQHYGWVALAPWQPVGAALIPPLAWLAFVSGTERAVRAADARHALGPIAAAAARASVPPLLDVLIPALFAGYALAILHRTRPRAALPAVRLDSGELPRSVWTTLAALLALSALSDVLIALVARLGHDALRLPIMSLASSLSLLIIGALVLRRDLGDRSPTRLASDARGAAGSTRGPKPRDGHALADAAIGASAETSREARMPATREDAPPGEGTRAVDDEERAARRTALERVDRALRDERLYLDPDLSLERLARRVGVPAKRLSAAINEYYGENVSRHVNRHRIEHACALLEAGRPITVAVFESGFNTRSNFTREFSRILGCSPTRWLAGDGRRGAGR